LELGRRRALLLVEKGGFDGMAMEVGKGVDIINYHFKPST
jgi:hypothetical protein